MSQWANNPPPPTSMEYAPSVFGGGRVPRVETHNPTGVIRCGDLSLTIEGQLVPVVDVMLGSQLGIYFEHHIVLWKDPALTIRMSSWKGGFQRFLAGIPIFQTQANGPGNIAFSRDSVGQIVCLKVDPGQTVKVREHQFILATQNVSYGVSVFPGASNILFARTGLVIDTFTCNGPHEGLVLLHGYGNVFERVLQPGEALDIEPGAWLWSDASVSMQVRGVIQMPWTDRRPST
ncbi:tryptophan RNA-binding attenuator protein-like domain-containing protein [Kockovaella imperatae]|uniref:Altered inheritance of mitochondria protein 24, mitochondrial n=1 Tax=Kockovaella imperatae TaxID=4999 RepID=A0A1Y1UL80_9TREE|nr:tryptophan RNA-binding attenuator protein-like domain-containing protein [Kockovaella imperatae]ORX38742.1 tryptophan RNA-binding attenuator protein-like domain-containing protein [Kockovaella imperatae]